MSAFCFRFDVKSLSFLLKDGVTWLLSIARSAAMFIRTGVANRMVHRTLFLSYGRDMKREKLKEFCIPPLLAQEHPLMAQGSLGHRTAFKQNIIMIIKSFSSRNISVSENTNFVKNQRRP